jgi:hypothetical protein
MLLSEVHARNPDFGIAFASHHCYMFPTACAQCAMCAQALAAAVCDAFPRLIYCYYGVCCFNCCLFLPTLLPKTLAEHI